MSFFYNPSLSTENLMLCLDAGNSKSYSGSGSIWNDLSGNNNTATMIGSVPYSVDIAACFDFATASGGSSASSSLGFSFASNMIQTTGNFTLSCWIKNPNSSSAQVGLFSNAGGADGYRFGVGLNGIYYLIGPTYTEGSVSFSSSLSSSLWYNVVAVFSRTTAQLILYLNGILQNTGSMPASQTAMQNGAPGIVRSPCCGIYTGKLAMFSAYNKALTSTEIMLNFAALRGRFGV